MDDPATDPNPLPHRGGEPHLLREIYRTYQALMSGFSRGMGMSASRFSLMRLLALSETEIGPMDVARQLGVNAAAVTRQLQELEREGLLRRRADPRDRRRSNVRLSPKGQKLFLQMHERSHELEQALEKVLGAGEMAAAARVLARLRTFVESFRGRHP